VKRPAAFSPSAASASLVDRPEIGRVAVVVSALGTLAAGAGTLGSAIAAILALRAASAAAPATRSKPSGKKSAARRTKK